MRGTWVIVVLLMCVGVGCDSSKKTSAPAPSAAPAKVAEVHETARDAGAAVDAGPTAAPPRRDPIASLFPVAYTPGKTLSDKLQRRIRFRLKDKSQAPIALHHIIDVPRPDGGREVFALYEYSVYEDCVLGYADRKDGREHCLGELVTVDKAGGGAQPFEGEQIRLNKNCVAVGAVRAVFGPPGPGETADSGGSLAISSLAFTDAPCEVRSYNRVLVADVDGDKKLKMYVDITTSKEAVAEIRDRPTKVQNSRRYLYLLSGNDVGNVELLLDLYGRDWRGESPPEEPVELRDVNRDGHLDVIQSKFCLKQDEAAMFEQPCDTEPREKVAYLYEAGKDAYKDGVEGRDMARGLHDRAMKSLAAKKVDDAAQMWSDAAALDPAWSWPPYNLACVAVLQGRPNDAIAQLRLLVDRAPDVDLLHRLDTDRDLAAVRDLPAFQEAVGAVAKAALSSHRFARPDGDDSSCKSMSLYSSGDYNYTCTGCCAFNGTYSYGNGRLRLEVTMRLTERDVGYGDQQTIRVRATYRVTEKDGQICFYRIEATGLTDDLPKEPLPDGCWDHTGEPPKSF